MSLRDLVVKARSYRRFQEDRSVSADVLASIVDMVRFVPSSVNLQPLRYAVSTSKEMNDKIFPHLAWARQLKNWGGPAQGERPSGYIVIAGDVTTPTRHLIVDLGIASQTIFLGLVEAGLAGCMIGSLNAKALHEIVGFSEQFNVVQVMAVGYPGETVVIEDMPSDGATPYWRSEDGVHHVPKRRLDDVLVKRFT